MLWFQNVNVISFISNCLCFSASKQSLSVQEGEVEEFFSSLNVSKITAPLDLRRVGGTIYPFFIPMSVSHRSWRHTEGTSGFPSEKTRHVTNISPSTAVDTSKKKMVNGLHRPSKALYETCPITIKFIHWLQRLPCRVQVSETRARWH